MTSMALNRVCGLLLIGLAGCEAQADPDYQGEPLFTAKGTLVASATPPEGDVDVAILWFPQYSNEDARLGLEKSDRFTLARVKVGSVFPSDFELEVFDLPPEPDKLGQGLIVAVPSDSPTTTTDADILGGVLGFAVLYFPDDGGPDPHSEVNVTANIYHVEPVKGFHFVGFKVESRDDEAAFFRCQYGNVCEHINTGLDDLDQKFYDDDYARCLRYTPNATTCNRYFSPTSAAEEAEDSQCFELSFAANTSPGGCVPSWSTESLDGKNEQLTLTMGVGITELLHPRYRE